jgi:DNA-binding NarL/FixJ family response regulator
MKILVADDHWVVRAGLKRLLKRLEGNPEIVEANDYDDALAVADQNSDIDLILLDLVMPGRQGLDGLQEIHSRVPEVPIIVMSVLQERRDVLRAIEHGAMGYIPKSSNGDEILKVVRLVLDGEICLPRALLERAQATGTRLDSSAIKTDVPAEAPVPPFTKRQKDVLYLLAEGISNRDIARELGLSEHTVRIHISAILRTLKITNRTQAALFAAEYFGRRPGSAQD